MSFLAHTKVALHSCSGVVFVAWAVRARNEMTGSFLIPYFITNGRVRRGAI